MRRLIAAIALGATGAVASCASPGYPPGGPEDLAAPRLVAIVPDSAATRVSPDRVLFRFDEVIDERSGGTDLSRLVLISPMDGEVDVDWRRQTLAVRPRRGRWRPNTVYTVTLLPGVRDLRGNTLNEGAMTVFSTGPLIPDTHLTGVAFDWAAGRALPLAFVQAISRPDSTVFITRADSSGRFAFRHLMTGLYTVLAFADANSNRGLDQREAWDTVQVSLTDTASAELYAFVHDTVGVAVGEVRVLDSLTLRLTLDRPLDVGQAVTPELFTLVDPDSSVVTITEAMGAREWEARTRARADSVAAAAPGARPPPPLAPPGAEPPADTLTPPRPVFGRPIPVTAVVLRLARPLAAETRYELRARSLRNLAGYARTSERTFTTPRRAPPPAADSIPPVPPPGAPPGGGRS